jgi:osmotically-inducible protein OsmY
MAFSLAGCCGPCSRPSPEDQQLAQQIRELIERAEIPGVQQVQVSAHRGHVTLGGVVTNPVALQRAVVLAAGHPQVQQLSFLGVQFEPPEVSDEELVERMRQAAIAAIGPDHAGRLGYYCEDHFGVVYGTLPSLALRRRLDEAIRRVEGVGPYFIAVEVVLPDPPDDRALEQAVRRKLTNPLDLRNLWLAGSHIQIRSRQNVVLLEGTVRHYLARLIAEDQVRQVEGVRYVINRLRVERPTLSPPMEIPQSPSTSLGSQPPIPASSVAPMELDG